MSRSASPTSTASCAASTSVARQVRLGAREGLRLLRRDRRLGFERPALRQRHLHRLAHRLSRRARAHPARDRPRRCRSRTACRSSCASSPSAAEAICPRGAPAPGARQGGGHGLRGLGGVRIRVLRLRRDAATRVRAKGYRDLKPMTPGLLRLLGAALARCMPSSTASCSTPAARWTCRIEGLHTETGPGVLEAAITRRRGAARRRQGGAVQDLHQGARPAARR